MGVDQRLSEAIGPGASRIDKAGLELGGIDVGGDAVGGADDELDAGEDRFRDLSLILDLGAAERVLQDPLKAAPEVGVVAIARHVDQARHEPGERIAAQEQPDLLPLLEVQDLLSDPEQLVVVGLQQLVARIGLEDVGQRLAGVPRRRQVGALDHLRDLVAQQRNVARVAVVRGRGEQPEEAVLADDLAFGVEPLHPDVVEIDRAMHGRAGIRLGDHERPGLARLTAGLGR